VQANNSISYWILDLKATTTSMVVKISNTDRPTTNSSTKTLRNGKKCSEGHHEVTAFNKTKIFILILVCLYFAVTQIHLSALATAGVLRYAPSQSFSPQFEKQGESLRPRLLERGEMSNATPAYKNVVVYICGGDKYCDAVVDSIQSLRANGGYTGNVVVIFNASGPQSRNESSSTQTARYVDNADASSLSGLLSLSDVIVLLSNDLIEDIIEKYPDLEYLRDPPRVPKCIKGEDRTARYAKYSKLLIYHPSIANRWDRVLFLDACMSYLRPHIESLFNMPEIRGHLLAQADPWRWRRFHLKSKINACPSSIGLETLHRLIGGKDPASLGYFNSALVLYDTDIVRKYKTRSTPSAYATIIEILVAFHTLTSVVTGGDQTIQSIYWIYGREEYASLPLTLLESDMVPYEFLVRLPDEPHILTGGNPLREVCNKRATNTLQLNAAKKLLP
jgi:hypothetical protein